ncbi:MAG TPA: zinc ribbon domain-containing protein [Gaiellaceae bacterium]|nr:zinc ribbon domain-containing protein [Gaiellaceae bacterium]
MRLLSRFRRADRARPVRHALPPAGVIRRERRALGQVREEKLRDLGGLMLEMYRRDVFREDLLAGRCNELLGLDARLRELDQMLAAARKRLPVGRCDCGAPLPWGSHFCPNCGRPAGERAVVACAECGHPLPGDARFCASCGAPSASEAQEADAVESGAGADDAGADAA